jgi:hypothetical protein
MITRENGKRHVNKIGLYSGKEVIEIYEVSVSVNFASRSTSLKGRLLGLYLVKLLAKEMQNSFVKRYGKTIPVTGRRGP